MTHWSTRLLQSGDFLCQRCVQIGRLNCSLMRFSMSPRAQYSSSYKACAPHDSLVNEVTTKRGFSLPAMCSDRKTELFFDAVLHVAARAIQFFVQSLRPP